MYISCLKKRRFYSFYTTNVSWYLQSSSILFVLCPKNKKNICIKYIKNRSSNEMKDIRIQFCKSLSKTFY